MNAKPILFQANMVDAILQGLKNQTRRQAKITTHDCEPGYVTPQGCHAPRTIEEHLNYCPYGKVGDVLWVRESWRILSWGEDGEQIQYPDGETLWVEFNGLMPDSYEEWAERITDQSCADCEKAGIKLDENGYYRFDRKDCPTRWRPSIHMPMWASRITLEITNVRLERLQEISANDALAEGIQWYGSDDDGKWCFDYTEGAFIGGMSESNSFLSLWESINGYESREANPWVWVVEFKPIRRNVYAVLADNR